MQIDDDLSGYSVADEKHQREWREWFRKTFDEFGNLRDPQAFDRKPDNEITQTNADRGAQKVGFADSLAQVSISKAETVAKSRKIQEHTF